MSRAGSANMCDMCHEQMKTGHANHKASCWHIFHKECFDEMDEVCPLCGKKIKYSRKSGGTKRKRKNKKKSKTKKNKRRFSIY